MSSSSWSILLGTRENDQPRWVSRPAPCEAHGKARSRSSLQHAAISALLGSLPFGQGLSPRRLDCTDNVLKELRHTLQAHTTTLTGGQGGRTLLQEHTNKSKQQENKSNKMHLAVIHRPSTTKIDKRCVPKSRRACIQVSKAGEQNPPYQAWQRIHSTWHSSSWRPPCPPQTSPRALCRICFPR